MVANEIVNVVPLCERRDLKIEDKVIYNRRLGNYSLAVLQVAQLPSQAIYKYRKFKERYQITFHVQLCAVLAGCPAKADISIVNILEIWFTISLQCHFFQTGSAKHVGMKVRFCGMALQRSCVKLRAGFRLVSLSTVEQLY